LNFNSFNYVLLFLPLVCVACQLARRLPIARAPQICILLASIVFYAWQNPSHLGYLLGSILVNWQIARWIGAATGKRRKRYLQLGLILNIGFLCVFKYLNFLMGNIPYLVHHKLLAIDLAPPLGISFFTLAQIMYLVDCYQELLPPSSLFDHATFVSFFPYVIMGPICRAKRILQQYPALSGPAGPSADTVARALYLFSLGLAKKVILADSFARIADAGFSSAQNISTIEAWIFSLSFTFQLYFDFSGYSDMAVASAWLLGIDIPQNFNAPYISKSITEFWQRWHITLSNFITNYLYTPILQTMGKATITTSVISVLIAMSIAGLWHGAAWTFVIFGTLHGCALAANQIWKRRKKKMPAWLGWLVTFVFVNLTLVFFRSANVPAALHMLNSMLPHNDLLGTAALTDVIPMSLHLLLRPVALGVVLAFFFKTSQQLAEKFRPSQFTALATATLLLVSMLFMNSTVAKQFVYFAF
jgi:alginate O-acetyltransferase complex protein AlgI